MSTPGRATGQATSTAELPSTSPTSVNERLCRAVVVAGQAQLESGRLPRSAFGGVARGPVPCFGFLRRGQGLLLWRHPARGPSYGAILSRQFRVACSLPPSDLLRGAVPRPRSVPGPSGAGRASTLLGKIRAPVHAVQDAVIHAHEQRVTLVRPASSVALGGQPCRYDSP
jgi:hypothetical protein